MAIGLGALFEGVQGGIATRDKMDLNREYKELLRQRAATGEKELAGRDRTAGALAEGLGTDYTPIAHQRQKDPALLRFGGWLKGKVGGMFGGQDSEEQGALETASFATPEIQPAGPQASGAQTYGIPGYADGGRVDEERKKRSYGDYYLTEDEANEMVTPVGAGMSGAKYRPRS